jgi:hypothetical protein
MTINEVRTLNDFKWWSIVLFLGLGVTYIHGTYSSALIN